MPYNTIGKQAVQNWESAGNTNFYPTGLTWDPTTYKYTIALTGGSDVVGGSQQVFGNQIKLSITADNRQKGQSLSKTKTCIEVK